MCNFFHICLRLSVRNVAYTTGLPSTGIVTLRLPCSARRTSQAALKSMGGKRRLRALSFVCAALVTAAVLHAAAWTANLQVFCR